MFQNFSLILESWDIFLLKLALPLKLALNPVWLYHWRQLCYFSQSIHSVFTDIIWYKCNWSGHKSWSLLSILFPYKALPWLAIQPSKGSNAEEISLEQCWADFQQYSLLYTGLFCYNLMVQYFLLHYNGNNQFTSQLTTLFH